MELLFGDEMRASKIWQALILTNTININLQNLIVAEYEKAIVGILCFIEEDYFDDKKAYQEAFLKTGLEQPQYFDEVFKVYWQKIIHEDFTNSYYISNVAVHKNYQNLGIGKMLLNYFKEKHKDKPIMLDVVKDNTSAIHAYLKSGFEILNKDSTKSEFPTPLRMILHRK